MGGGRTTSRINCVDYFIIVRPYLSEIPRLLLLIGGTVRLLVGSIVGCHHGHRLLGWLLHHLRSHGCWVLLSDKIHHALTGLLRRHGHGCPHTVRATARLRRALDRVV